MEPPPSAIRRFLAEFTSYMQIILVGASVVSLVIQEWSTAIVLIVITLFNALVGLRQAGKAESAMNALQSMMKATARVRRDGTEAEIPAEQVVAGDVVLIAAGDEVPADGRIVTSSALQIDESALTGESVPAAKDAETLTGGDIEPGEQSDMAFMHTPVTHGSGVVIVTGTGSDTQVGKIAHMLSSTAKEETPLTKQMNTLTLWIVGAAGLTMIIMFALGLSRGQSWKMLFDTAVALAIAAIPLALPMVVQVVLSLGSVELAKQKAIVKDLPSVETLGFTSAINSDKTGTLTMNQMTAVEVVDPTDRYAITGTGYSLEGKIIHPAGKTDTLDDAILPYVVASDAKLANGKVVGDPTEGALLVLAHKAGVFIDATREELPRLATLPFDPSYKLMATFNQATDVSGNLVVRCFVKGAAPAVLARAATALANGTSIPWDDALREKANSHVQRMEGEGLRVMAAAVKDLDPATFDPDGDLLALVQGLQMTSLVGMVDPPREESKAAVADAQEAHIRVRMVTGDDVITGAAIARQLNIPGEAILGADFAALPEADRLERIDRIGVVGRVAPEHKVLLAETLKKKGHVVAMTGDGVNDAPAIKAADIGVAMGSGTEVAKNAGRMILSDDNFATIVYAVEQGRKLYDNLSKYIRFVLLELVAFVLTFLGATLFNLRRRTAVHAGADPVDQLRRQCPVRRRARLRQAAPRPDEPPAPPARGVDPDPCSDDHLRPRGAVHRGRQPGADRHREEPLRQHQDRPVDGSGRLLPDARGRRLRGSQREGHRLRRRHLQQLQDERDRRGRDRRGIPHHPGELHEPAPRYRPADRRAVGVRVVSPPSCCCSAGKRASGSRAAGPELSARPGRADRRQGSAPTGRPCPGHSHTAPRVTALNRR